jgi:hypothetical protein
MSHVTRTAHLPLRIAAHWLGIGRSQYLVASPLGRSRRPSRPAQLGWSAGRGEGRAATRAGPLAGAHSTRDLFQATDRQIQIDTGRYTYAHSHHTQRNTQALAADADEGQKGKTRGTRTHSRGPSCAVQHCRAVGSGRSSTYVLVHEFALAPVTFAILHEHRKVIVRHQLGHSRVVRADLLEQALKCLSLDEAREVVTRHE